MPINRAFLKIIHYSSSSHDTLYWLYIVLCGLNIVVEFHSFYVIYFFLEVFATKLQPRNFPTRNKLLLDELYSIRLHSQKMES